MTEVSGTVESTEKKAVLKNSNNNRVLMMDKVFFFWPVSQQPLTQALVMNSSERGTQSRADFVTNRK